jgi:hypothetical protein
LKNLLIGIVLMAGGLAIIFLVKADNIAVPIAGAALVLVGGFFMKAARRSMTERVVQKYAKK